MISYSYILTPQETDDAILQYLLSGSNNRPSAHSNKAPSPLLHKRYLYLYRIYLYNIVNNYILT